MFSVPHKTSSLKSAEQRQQTINVTMSQFISTSTQHSGDSTAKDVTLPPAWSSLGKYTADWEVQWTLLLVMMTEDVRIRELLGR